MTKEETSAEKILLPQIEVKTLRGNRVVVEPWGLTKGRLMLKRLEELMEKGRQMPEATVAQLIELAYDEFYGIVRDTLGWDDARMEKELTLEDMIALSEAIWKTSVAREDGGGVGGKLGALIVGLTRMVNQIQAPAAETNA
jgi:hypothetical protein